MIFITSLLIKLFVKESDDVKNIKVREGYGKLSGIVGVILNAILSGSKIICGIIFNSVSIVADGLNNLSDATSSLVTFIGFKLSGRPADKEHPYGHARMEYVTALAVAVFILIVGFELFKTSIDKIFHPEVVSLSIFSIVTLILSIFLKLWLYFFNSKLSKAINSSALMATATDSRNDVIMTVAVLISAIIIEITSFAVLDGLLSLAIAIFIMVSSVKLLSETLSPLLGEAPSKELVADIMKKVKSYDGVLGVHDLMVHDYGPGRCFASVHVEMDAKNDILQSHDICDIIERDFKKDNITLVVHLDPIITDNEEINELKALTLKAVTSLELGIGMHDFRVVKGYTHTNVIFDIVASFDCSKTDEELKDAITEFLQNENPKLCTVINVDRDYTG